MALLECQQIETLGNGKLKMCTGYFELTFESQEFFIEALEESITVSSCPILRCVKCGYCRVNGAVRAEVQRKASDIYVWRSEGGEEPERIDFSSLKELRYPDLSGIKFKYDFRDNYASELIYHKGGSCTPVFFDEPVLGKYRTANQIDWFANDYGRISLPDGNSLEFGITKTKKVIIWHSTLTVLPMEELHYLRAFNCDSDHMLSCSFHDALLDNLKLPTKASEDVLFELQDEYLVEASKRAGGDVCNLREEMMAIRSKFRKPFTFDGESFAQCFKNLNRILIESIKDDSFRNQLGSGGHKIEKGLKGLKITEQWFLQVLGWLDAGDLMCPFFVVNDLRQLDEHLKHKDEIKTEIHFACERLGIAEDSEFEDIYKALISRLIKSYREIIQRLVPPTTR